MDPAIGGALIGGAFDIAGGVLSGQSAAAEARKQRQWAARQYGKRYQVAVEDLKKAGLNPMLAYMGQGAAGGGSVPHGAAGPGYKLEGVGSRAVGNFLQAQAVKSSIALNVASARKAEAEAGYISGAQTTESSARSSVYGAQVVELSKRVEQMAFEISRGQSLLPGELEKLQADIRNVNASALPKELIGELATAAMEVLRALKKPSTSSTAREMARDTLNLIDDKINQATDVAHSAGKSFRQRVKDLPRTISDWAKKR